MTAEQLKPIIEAHGLWCRTSGREGKRLVLRGAVLRGADLSGADLSGAVLRGAVLRGAVLRGAVLRGAVLRDADLRDAVLRGAVLRDADLTPIKDDLYKVLSLAANEVPTLLAAIEEGRVDGSHYQGECACLVGTIANARHCNYMSIEGLVPDSKRPVERWFLAIRKGDTPATNPISAITAEWVREWIAANAQSATAPR